MTAAKHDYRHPLCGFSLVELMIAISLGLLIIAVVAGIFLSGNRNYAQDERYARVQENARFAMKALTTDIASADFWGGMTDSGSIVSALANTCGITLNGTNAFKIYPDASTASADGISCVTTAKDNTSVIVIKRVQGACLANAGDTVFSAQCATTAPVNGKVYLRASGNNGTLLTASSATVAVGERYWEYIPHIYFIRNFAAVAGDGIPTLVRKDLQAGAMVDVPLVEGIENFRVELGTLSGTEAPLPVKVHVLARSIDRDLAYDTNRAGTKTYQLGGACFTTAGTDPCLALTTVDNTPHHYYRRVFSTTVAVRNPGLLAQFQ